MADYINGREMHEELVKYHNEYKKSIQDGTEKPLVSNKLGEAFVQIATRLMNRPNFMNYSYKDDMISDAILQCFAKVHTYDPEKANQEYGSAFSWATQLAWNAAIGRIKKEQHQSSVKAKLIREKLSSDFIQHGVDADEEHSDNSFVNFLKENDAFIDYNELREQNIAKQKKSSLTHRNKTPYKKRDKMMQDMTPEISIEDFMQ